jgi:hypothetical protein
MRMSLNVKVHEREASVCNDELNVCVYQPSLNPEIYKKYAFRMPILA